MKCSVPTTRPLRQTRGHFIPCREQRESKVANFDQRRTTGHRRVRGVIDYQHIRGLDIAMHNACLSQCASPAAICLAICQLSRSLSAPLRAM